MASLLCCKCKKSNDRLPQKYCRECHALYMREHRPKHSELPSDQRLRANARSYANVYLRRGKIKRENCSVCDEKAEMHHEDYSKPLKIIWLCRTHHLMRHVEQSNKTQKGCKNDNIYG